MKLHTVFIRSEELSLTKYYIILINFVPGCLMLRVVASGVMKEALNRDRRALGGAEI